MYASRAEMDAVHQAEVNTLPIVFAFSNQQFEEGAREMWGIDAHNKEDLKKVRSIGAGGYMLATDLPKLHEMMERHTREKKEFTSDFKNLVERIKYEMYNHEYTYVPYEVEEEVKESLAIYQDHPRFEEAWEKAKREVLKAAGFEGID